MIQPLSDLAANGARMKLASLRASQLPDTSRLSAWMSMVYSPAHRMPDNTGLFMTRSGAVLPPLRLREQA